MSMTELASFDGLEDNLVAIFKQLERANVENESSGLDMELLDAGESMVPEMTISNVVTKWVHNLRHAFYGKGVPKKNSGGRFLQLEEVVMSAFDRIGHDDNVWNFAVELFLHLVQHDKVQNASGHLNSENDRHPKEKVDSANKKTLTRKQKKKEKAARPNAPLIFVVLNALKNLHERRSVDKSIEGSKGNESSVKLLDFCRQSLEDPVSSNDKMVVEILELFQQDDITVSTLHAFASHLILNRSFSSLIRLYSAFPEAGWDYRASLNSIALERDWGSAELFASTFEEKETRDLTKLLVEQALELSEYKRAHRIVHSRDLRAEFPDVDMLYNRDSLARLMHRRQWQLATSFVGNDKALQEVLLEGMARAGEQEKAVELAEEFGMKNFRPAHYHVDKNLTSETIPSEFLPFELDIERDVFFCDSEDAVRIAYEYIFTPKGVDGSTQKCWKAGDNVVGLDVEWKPTIGKDPNGRTRLGTKRPASILQIAVKSRVFIVDLLALHENDYLLDTFLLDLFVSSELLKVGFGFKSDLQMLRRTFPERKSFACIKPFLEFSAVSGAAKSLSKATSKFLGKPLDKEMQTSNWEARPLRKDQLRYAAMDAFSLVQMTREIGYERIGCDVTWEDLISCIHEISYSSRISEDEVQKAVRKRREYQTLWAKGMDTDYTLQSRDIRMLNTSDVVQYWKDESERAKDNSQTDAQLPSDAVIDWSIQVLPTSDLHEFTTDGKTPAGHSAVLINSICFFAGDQPYVACLEAGSKLDMASISRICGVGRRKVKLATALQCESTFGAPPGTIPPFGHRPQEELADDASKSPQSIPIFVDEQLTNFEYAVGGSSSNERLLVFSMLAFMKLMSIQYVGPISTASVARASQVSTKPSVINADGSEQSKKYRFIADSMVTRVGRWLRTVGLDVLFWETMPQSSHTAGMKDRKQALLQVADQEGRILLTRDKKLVDRRDAGACFLFSNDDPYEQIQQLRRHFGLELDASEIMTRCAKCNAKALARVDKNYVRTQTGLVAEKVLNRVDEFWICQECDKIYWEGPKYSSTYANMQKIFNGERVDLSD